MRKDFSLCPVHIPMSMDGDMLMNPHLEPAPVLIDFGDNLLEDFAKSLFADIALVTISDDKFNETTDAGYFKSLSYSEFDDESFFERVDTDEKLEMTTSGLKASGLQTIAEDSSCFSTEAQLHNVFDYENQAVDLKHMSMDAFIPTGDLSTLVSTRVKPTDPDNGTEISGTTVADELSCLFLEGFDAGKNCLVDCVAENLYYSLLSGSTQMCENILLPPFSINSSTVQAQTPHISNSEYPVSLPNISLDSIVHATDSSPSSESPCILNEYAGLSIQTSSSTSEEGILFDEEMQPGFNLLSSLKQGGNSSASAEVQNLSAEADYGGGCLGALHSQFSCTLRNRLMQKSFSSHTLGQLRTPRFSPKDESVEYIMRRIYSTGDIQTLTGKLQSIPFNSDDIKSRETKSQIGCYTIEERTSKVHRYRQKRNKRNFHKNIKYACRKSLADSRPRVKGRFATNEESVAL